MLKSRFRNRGVGALVVVALVALVYLDIFAISPWRWHLRLPGLEINVYFPQSSRHSHRADDIRSPRGNKFNFLSKYPFYMKCRSNLSGWATEVSNEEVQRGFLDSATYHPDRKRTHSRAASGQKTSSRITRAMVFYFPLDKISYYELEFKWFYNSWVEMQKHEPSKWRTDLVLFADTDTDKYRSIKSDCFLTKLNCTLSNRRTSPLDPPMCSIVPYKPMKSREVHSTNVYNDNKSKYEFLLNDVDIFSDDFDNLLPFYSFLKESENYEYLESILVAFEGYQYFKQSGYDFLVRSDMDVFLTPLFGKWVPNHCNDFYVGGGGFSRPFSNRRLERAARSLDLKHAGVEDLGSTWYSTPEQFRLVAYLTLFGIGALTAEEFAYHDRYLIGVALWPYWHYGVILLYGQSLMLNHLIAARQMNIIKLDTHIDHHSDNSDSVHDIIHIHVFQGDDLFSKHWFREGKYNDINVGELDAREARYYALKMATLARNLSSEEIFRSFQAVSKQFNKD